MQDAQAHPPFATVHLLSCVPTVIKAKAIGKRTARAAVRQNALCFAQLLTLQGKLLLSLFSSCGISCALLLLDLQYASVCAMYLSRLGCNTCTATKHTQVLRTGADTHPLKVAPADTSTNANAVCCLKAQTKCVPMHAPPCEARLRQRATTHPHPACHSGAPLWPPALRRAADLPQPGPARRPVWARPCHAPARAPAGAPAAGHGTQCLIAT